MMLTLLTCSPSAQPLTSMLRAHHATVSVPAHGMVNGSSGCSHSVVIRAVGAARSSQGQHARRGQAFRASKGKARAFRSTGISGIFSNCPFFRKIPFLRKCHFSVKKCAFWAAEMPVTWTRNARNASRNAVTTVCPKCRVLSTVLTV